MPADSLTLSDAWTSADSDDWIAGLVVDYGISNTNVLEIP